MSAIQNVEDVTFIRLRLLDDLARLWGWLLDPDFQLRDDLLDDLCDLFRPLAEASSIRDSVEQLDADAAFEILARCRKLLEPNRYDRTPNSQTHPRSCSNVGIESKTQ